MTDGRRARAVAGGGAGRRLRGVALSSIVTAGVLASAPGIDAAEAEAVPLPPPVGAPLPPPADRDAPPLPQPPADARPPLPLPGESGHWQRQDSGACAAADEAACSAVPTCSWVKIYGPVPGQPTAGFCHPRTALPEARTPE